MTTFYPGPSKVYPQVRQYLADAYDSGILSVNHRSGAFMEMYEKTFRLLREKLNIPADYTLVFVSSATECWEIIAQSFVKDTCLHFYNGAFGEKWFEYTRKIKPNASSVAVELNGSVFESSVVIERQARVRTAEVICLTHNETSNGTQISTEEINKFRQEFADKLIAVDATSSLGGADLRIENADLWFASVQKCLGLPAGLGLLLVSPRAVAAAERLGDRRFYNSFLFMRENSLKFQTHYTPNVLNIYLLMRVLEQVENVSTIANRLKKQAVDWYDLLESHSVLKPLVGNRSVRSETVIAVTAAETTIAAVKKRAQAAGITLGNGYGAWKNNTFRIANFPAISDDENHMLETLLKTSLA